MDFIDIIKEFRKGTPDIRRVVMAVKIFSLVCFLGGVGFLAFYKILSSEEIPFELPANYLYAFVLSSFLIGSLFYYSSKAIQEMRQSGKRIAQFAIILLIIQFGFFFIFMFTRGTHIFREENITIIVIFFVIFFGQFGSLGYLGVRYLERLPLNKSGYPGGTVMPATLDENMEFAVFNPEPGPIMKYSDALLPFGIFGTFLFVIGVFFVLMFAMYMYFDPMRMAIFAVTLFLFLFLSMIFYNFTSSPFQKVRTPVVAFTGGVSIFFFNAGWPFCRLLVYEDGVEIRCMFHRFFLPYDKMEDIPKKLGPINRGILFRTSLPGVPSGIRYYGFRMKRVLEVINRYRNEYLTKRSS